MSESEYKIKEYGVDEFDIKTIKDKALLVRLIRRKFNNSKADNILTKKVQHDAKIEDKSAVRVFKSLYPKECIAAYTKYMNEASIYFYTMTTPWEDTGFRLLLIKNHSEFTTKMRQYIEDFNEAVENFLNNLEENKKVAKIALGDAYDPNDYFDADTLKNAFKLEVKFSSIPDVEDIRLSLPKEEIEQIKKDIKDQLQEKVKRTTDDLWNRMLNQLNYIQKQMEEVKKPNKLRNTIITNIRDICNLVSNLNITQDKAIERMKNVVLNRLRDFDIEDIREDETVRKDLGKTAKELADDIEAKMQDYIG